MILEKVKTLLPKDFKIIIGDVPETPDDVCSLFSTGGYPPIRMLGKKNSYIKYPTFQIRTRSKSYNKAQLFLGKCWQAVEGYSDDKIKNIVIMSDIFYLGRDEKGRAEFTLNFKAEVHCDEE